MAFSIANWNIAENIDWYVRIATHNAGLMSVSLHLTADHANNNQYIQASARVSYGSNVQAVLAQNLTTQLVSFFKPELPWHLQVNGAYQDPTKVFHVFPFIDLPEIQHPIYANTDLALCRATAELDAHTHLSVDRELSLGSHLPTTEPGQIVRLNSSRMNRDARYQVIEHVIATELGNEARMLSTIRVRSYQPITR